MRNLVGVELRSEILSGSPKSPRPVLLQMLEEAKINAADTNWALSSDSKLVKSLFSVFLHFGLGFMQHFSGPICLFLQRNREPDSFIWTVWVGSDFQKDPNADIRRRTPWRACSSTTESDVECSKACFLAGNRHRESL